MKINRLKTVCFIAFSIISLSAFAQTSLTIDVKEPGTLETLIGETKYTLSEIKLTGEINVHDFDILHQCASRGVLEKIDLFDVKLPSDEIPDKAFFETESGSAWSLSLKSIILPKTLKRIGYWAFAACSSMESIQMPETLSELDVAFYECLNLKSIIIPAGVTEIKERTFRDCIHLKTVQLPDGLKKIGYAAFYCCHELKTINLPESLETIGDLTFALNNELDIIIIPQNVTDIGIYAFQNCLKLRSIELSHKLKEIKDGTFAYVGDSLKEINIPEGIERIGEDAFFWVYELTKVKLPSTLVSIGEGAFSACNLDTIVFPESLNFIGTSAFAGCENMKCIYSMNPIPPKLEDTIPSFHSKPVFDGIYKDACVLYVPVGSSDLYRSASGWQDFYQIVETDKFPSSVGIVASATDCQITSFGGEIRVENPTDMPISVNIYAINGSLVRQEKVVGTFALTVSPGIYLVKVNDKAQKVLVE